MFIHLHLLTEVLLIVGLTHTACYDLPISEIQVIRYWSYHLGINVFSFWNCSLEMVLVNINYTLNSNAGIIKQEMVSFSRIYPLFSERSPLWLYGRRGFTISLFMETHLKGV